MLNKVQSKGKWRRNFGYLSERCCKSNFPFEQLSVYFLILRYPVKKITKLSLNLFFLYNFLFRDQVKLTWFELHIVVVVVRINCSDQLSRDEVTSLTDSSPIYVDLYVDETLFLYSTMYDDETLFFFQI